MKKEEEKVLMVAQEIHFAKALAANDKQLRERALRRLNKWLCLKSKSSLGLLYYLMNSMFVTCYLPAKLFVYILCLHSMKWSNTYSCLD